MWVIIETKNHKRYTRVFKRKFIKYGIFMLVNKIKGNKVSIVYENDNLENPFKVITILCFMSIAILLCLFLYCCYGLYRSRECQKIDFQSKSCEKWRNY